MADTVLAAAKPVHKPARLIRRRREAATTPLVAELAKLADEGQQGDVSDALGAMSREDRHRVLFGPK